MKFKIYCEAGAMTREVKALKNLENVELIGLPFEEKNRKVTTAIKPSNLTIDSTFITCDNSKIKISETEKSIISDQIGQIIGKKHINDIRHIDTAYKENCKIFITPDKGDIISNKTKLEELTGIKFFHPSSIKEIKELIDRSQ